VVEGALIIAALVVGLLAGAIVASALWRSRARQAAERHAAGEAAAVRRADALSRSLAELRAAVDLLPGGLVVVDRAGELIVRNGRAESFLGVAHLDALLEQSVESHLRNALAGDERADTLEILGPPRRTLVVRGSVLAVEDEVAGAMVTVEDISERVRIDSVRTDLVANLSHELKTPVGAIALLAETLADEDEPEVIARLGPKLINEAHRLARIIDELLELSRIELGEQSLAEVVSVTGVLEEAMGFHRALATARDIGVHADLPEVEPGVVGNRRQLVSAVGNLLENAIKYSDAGSDVEVRVSADPEEVEISVRDHGIGIPGRDLDRIFERFYRVDKARSRETGGSGLGLSIVRHVMTNHGGVVTVTSAEGEGSTFTLRLPVARERHLAAGVHPKRPSAIAQAG
jgi:two-component system sensor histidine kinase SenX3